MKICLTLFLFAFFCQQGILARYVERTSSNIKANHVKEDDKVVNHILNKPKEDNLETNEDEDIYNDTEDTEDDDHNVNDNVYIKSDIQYKEISSSVENQLNEVSKLVDLNIEMLSNITSNAASLTKKAKESLIKVFSATAHFKTGFEDNALEREEMNLIKKAFESLSNLFKDFTKFAGSNSKSSKSEKPTEAEKRLVEESIKSYIEIFQEIYTHIMNLFYELEENSNNLVKNQDVVVKTLQMAFSDIQTLDNARKAIVLPVKMSDTEISKTKIKNGAIEMSSTRARLRRRRRRQRRRIMRRFRMRRRQHRRRLRRARRIQRRRRNIQRRRRRRRMRSSRRRLRQMMRRRRARRRRFKQRIRRKEIVKTISRRRRRNQRITVSRNRRYNQIVNRRHRQAVNKLKSRLQNQNVERRPESIRPIRRRRQNRRRQRPFNLNRDISLLSRPHDDYNAVSEIEQDIFKEPEVLSYSNWRQIRRTRRRNRRLRRRLRKSSRRRNRNIRRRNRQRRRKAMRRRRIVIRRQANRRRRRRMMRRRWRRKIRREDRRRRRNMRRRTRLRQNRINRMLKQRIARNRIRMRRRNQKELEKLKGQIRTESNQLRPNVRRRPRPFDQIPDETQIEREPKEEHKKQLTENKVDKKEEDNKLSELNENDDLEY